MCLGAYILLFFIYIIILWLTKINVNILQVISHYLIKWYNITRNYERVWDTVGLDFFKDGNELKQKSKEELKRDIENIVNENEIMINELKEKEKIFLKDNKNKLNIFLIEELSFVLTTDDDNEKIYKFVKNKEEYSIEISSSFIIYREPKKCETYAWTVSYENDNWDFESLKEDEYITTTSSYSNYSKDISQYWKEYNNSKKVFDENTRIYKEVKDLDLEDLFIFKIKESGGSISKYEKKCETYNHLIDFVKKILN